MKWTQDEFKLLSPILNQIQTDLEPLENKSILVLCSAGGEIAFRLAKEMKQGRVFGLELNPQLLEYARRLTKEQGLENTVEFHQAEKTSIPFPGEFFDALVSEFILYPTSDPTEIGQPEMARVLKSGGVMLLTDVIVTRPVPPDVRAELKAIGLDYLCEGTQDDFRRWMEEAGLKDITITDMTPIVRQAWQKRRGEISAKEPKGYTYLLDNPNYCLGETIFYIYVCGNKP